MRLVAIVLAGVVSIACGGEPPPAVTNTTTGGVPGESVDLEAQAGRPAPEYAGTGEAIDGAFVLGDASMTMTPDGEFARVRATGATDGGSYLVTVDGKLVLFVERIGESRLTTARPEVYVRSDLVPAP